MLNSAQALGQDGLRLRSRRVRSDRSKPLSVGFALTYLVAVSLLGFVGAILPVSDLRLATISVPGWMPGRSAPPSQLSTASAAGLPKERQSYLTAVSVIDSGVQHTALRMGLLTAMYESDEVGSGELKRELDLALANYRHLEEQIQDLQPPPELQTTHDRYLSAVRLLQSSAVEMLKTNDDGDRTHIVDAIALNAEAVSRLQLLSSQFCPPG